MAEITRERVGTLLQALFHILSTEPEGLQAREALERLSKTVKLTSFEVGNYKSGGQRFDKIVRFGTLPCVSAGWLTKQNGRWSITDVGRHALSDYPDPAAFLKAAVNIYDNKQKARSPDSAHAAVVHHDVLDASTSEPDVATAAETSAAVTYEQAKEQAWTQIEQYVHAMDPYAFQDLIAGLLKGMGYHVTWKAPPGPDSGVDIIASSDPLGTTTPRIKVQVRRTIAHTDTDAVKSFAAVLSDNDVGVFVSCAGFTKSALAFARHHSKQQVTLIDLDRLFELWTEAYKNLEEAAKRLLPLIPIHYLTPAE